MADVIEKGANRRGAEDASNTAQSDHPDYVTAAEAMKILNVRQQTLYAYVSRGLIRSVGQSGHKERLYWRDDLKRLESRSLARHGHGAVAASAMNFGEPIIPTSVTEITPEGPRYRGRLATDLARARIPFEAVAQLLWTGMLNETVFELEWPKRKPCYELNSHIEASWQMGSGNLLDMFSIVTLYLANGMQSAARRSKRPTNEPVDLDMASAGIEIIQTLVGCCGLMSPVSRFKPMEIGHSVAQGILSSLGIESTEINCESIDALLILLADHELSPATVATRVSASTGCTLHRCVVSGIAASTGSLTGQLYDRVEEFFDSASTMQALMRRADTLLERGVAIPGFGHPIYPKGDPRARYMLDLARRRNDNSRQMNAIYQFVDQVSKEHGLLPRQEFGTVVLTRAMGLPRRTSGAISAIARVAGWLAHVQEQRMYGTVLRPRAQFVGSPLSKNK
jgi:citrate synthase